MCSGARAKRLSPPHSRRSPQGRDPDRHRPANLDGGMTLSPAVAPAAMVLAEVRKRYGVQRNRVERLVYVLENSSVRKAARYGRHSTAGQPKVERSRKQN